MSKIINIHKCKTFRKALQTLIGQQVKKGNHELEFYTKGVLDLYNRFHPEKEPERVISITLEGWKGEGQMDIYYGFENNFVVIEHIKDKETSEVKQTKHEVSKVNVNKLLFIIKKWEIGEEHSCYEVAEMLGFDWQDLWAKRVKDYFPKYYYPIKVLEKIGIITYSGRGKVKKIK